MTTRSGRRIAVNPIPYWSKAGKTKEVLEEAFADFAKIGYSAVKADVPDGMDVQEYADWIGSYGLAPRSACSARPSTRRLTSPKRSSGPNGSPERSCSSAWTGP